MGTQQSIYDLAERRKQEGIEVSYRNAESIWKKAATARLRWLAENCREFTSDQIVTYLDEQGITTGNNSALGAIFQAAARMGIIQPTSYYKESIRPKRHQAPVRIWRSNVFKSQRRV
jgi:post-segregation antitoxin (ccd killing protein)